MQVFKFGGASVKDAEAVKNVAEVLKQFPNQKLCVVISAMGKMTNALEKLANAFFYNSENANDILEEIKQFHFSICSQLFSENTHPIYNELENTFVELHWAIEDEPTHSYDFEYDQIISMGETISTKIISAYLNEIGILNKWVDARGLIQTDNTYREGKVDFELTEVLVTSQIMPILKTIDIVVTQGFIGGTSENFTTTLGREGSDYTASIIAYCLNAESVTIWKDVPGMLNADPKYFEDTKKLEQISFKEAIELSYYGASVIHPKTIKPLQNKNIPLYVKSFLDPTGSGTEIQANTNKDELIPSFIIKQKQLLISITPKDFSFIAEENLAVLFNILFLEQIKINLMQNSALSFSILVDENQEQLTRLLSHLANDYIVKYNDNLSLVTIRHYDDATIALVTKDKESILTQKTRQTIRLVLQ